LVLPQGQEDRHQHQRSDDYTDYAEDATLMAGELKAAHIDASFNGISADQWNADVADGKYGSAIVHWGDSVVSPFGVYNYWLNSSLNNGTDNSGDYEGLTTRRWTRTCRSWQAPTRRRLR
jgi:hypothetical protein